MQWVGASIWSCATAALGLTHRCLSDWVVANLSTTSWPKDARLFEMMSQIVDGHEAPADHPIH